MRVPLNHTVAVDTWGSTDEHRRSVVHNKYIHKCTLIAQQWILTHRRMRHYMHTITTVYFHFLSNWPAFPELLHLSHTHKRITFNIPGADLLRTGCTSCCPTNSVRALKDLYLETCKFRGEHDRFHRPGHTVSSQCTLDSCHQETFPGSFSSTLQFLLYRLHESQLASPYQIHLQHTSHSRNQSNIFHLPIQYKWLISTKHYKHLLY